MRRRMLWGVGVGVIFLLGAVALGALRKLPFWYGGADEATLREVAAIERALHRMSFDIARIEDGEIVTFSASTSGSLVEYTPKERLPLKPIIGEEHPSKCIYLIERRGATLRFVLGGSVDDRRGLLYAREGRIDLEDIAWLSKVVGHPEWYEFDTQGR